MCLYNNNKNILADTLIKHNIVLVTLRRNCPGVRQIRRRCSGQSGRINPNVLQVRQYLLRGEGAPATITMKVSDISGKQALLGSVFVSLNRLEAQGLAVSRYPDPEATTTRHFTVTMLGERALAAAKQTSTAIARFLADFA
jgi:DNA-binding MarR family transcriptional regulator